MGQGVSGIACSTHHYACDCREAEFARMQGELVRLRMIVEGLRQNAPSGIRQSIRSIAEDSPGGGT